MRETRSLGGLGRDLLALEQELQRVAGRQKPRHALRSAGARKEPDLDLGQADLGLVVVGEHAMMAGERELEGAAEANAMDRDREGLAAGLEAPIELRQLARALEEELVGCFRAFFAERLPMGRAALLQHREIGAA